MIDSPQRNLSGKANPLLKEIHYILSFFEFSNSHFTQTRNDLTINYERKCISIEFA